MGSLFGGRISSTNSYKTDSKNPNPYLFRVLLAITLQDFIVAEIQYIGCTNFEGKKILVFKGMTMAEFTEKLQIDPHFNEYSQLVARFVPTIEGWDMALQFVRSWINR